MSAQKTETVKESAQEKIKRDSNYLRGNLAAELEDDSPRVSDKSYELLKFFGSYQGYDRDSATARKKAGLDKEWEFMLRLKLPGGRMTAEQYLALDRLCDERAGGSLRITSRQTFQFHQIIKRNLKPFVAEINQLLLSTLGGCGDVVRNVITCPAPFKNKIQQTLEQAAYDLAQHLAPKTGAYHDIFLNGERVEGQISTPPSGGSRRAQATAQRDAVGVSNNDLPPHPDPLPQWGRGNSNAPTPTLSPTGGEGSERKRAGEGVEQDPVEPLYGRTYMPRKFKIAIGRAEDNCMDVLCNDLAFIAIFAGDELTGYNIALGGGLGMKHNNPKTYPRLATMVAFVEPQYLLRAAEAVVKLQRDFGDRSNRQHARLKYVVEENGTEWTRSKLEEYFGAKLDDPKPIDKWAICDHMGWHEQGDGRWFLGIPIASGRIVDTASSGYRSALRELLQRYKMPLILTNDQNLILADIAAGERQKITEILRKYEIRLHEDITPLERNFIACVALPTCGKALAEAERVQDPLVKSLNALMAEYGLSDSKIAVRIAGCPNGCSRPNVGDIGIIGRMPGHYVICVGGDFEGTRLNQPLFDKVPLEHVTTALKPLVGKYASERRSGEGFGDYCLRIGIDELKQEAARKLGDKYKWAGG